MPTRAEQAQVELRRRAAQTELDRRGVTVPTFSGGGGGEFGGRGATGEWEEPLPKAGITDVPGIAGRAIVRAELGVGKSVLGTLDAILNLPEEKVRKVGTPWAPSQFARTPEEKLKRTAPIREAKRRIMSAQERFDTQYSGSLAWGTRIVGEAIPYMANAMVGGVVAGPVGAAMVGFTIEGDNAADAAVASLAKQYNITHEQVLADPELREMVERERVVVGSINAGIEALQIGRLLKFSKSGKHSLRSFIKLVRDKGILAASGQIKNFTAGVLRLSIENAIEEFLQEGVSIGTPALLRGDYPKKADGSPDYWAILQQLGEATLGGAVAGPILGAAGRAVTRPRAGVEQVTPAPEAVPAPDVAVADQMPVEGVEIPPKAVERVGEEPEKLTGSAIRLKSGEMLTGTTHANILRDIKKSGRIITNEEFDIPAGSGFVTDTGRFVSPKEGWNIAEKAGQLKLTGEDAMAQEFIDRKHLIAEGVDFAEAEAKPEPTLIKKGQAPITQQERKQLRSMGMTVVEIGKTPVSELRQKLGIGEPELIAEPKPPRMSRRKLLKLGHQLPKKLGWDDAQRRDFMQQTVGKPSMKGMTPKEMKALVTALQGEAREAGLLPPEDYQKTMFIGTREVKTEEFFDKALAEVEGLERKTKKKPKVITRRGQRRKRGLLKTAKAISVGIDNLSIPHLVRKIGGAADGLLKEVGVTNYRRSIHRISSVFRGGVDQLNTALDKADVTPKDLAEMSQQLDPRLALIQRGRELIGEPKAKQHIVELNGKQFSLSTAELLDIYLSAQQEEGMGHIEKAGLKIFGEKAGPLTKEQLQPLLDLVSNDPKAKAFADAVVKISDEYNAPQLNYTHSRVNPEAPEKLADKKNYWHLNVDKPLRIKGRGTYSISLLENKSILRPRKGPKGALIIGDAFSKFFSVQYAVAEYVGMAEELRLLNMVLNYEPIIGELESKGYGDVRNNLKQLIEWVQDPKSSVVRADKLVSKILHGAYRAVLHFSPEVILSQYMSTGHYAGVVDPKYIPLLSVPPTPKLIKEMLEHNPVVWTRYYAGGQSAELAETGRLDASLRLLTGKRADLNKTGIAAQLTDLAAFGQGWKLAKAFIDDTTQLKKESPEYWDAVSDKAEELWDTQPSWDKWNKSVNTSQRGIKRLPFLFRSYFEKSLMMLSTANETYKASGKTTADKAKWSRVYGVVIGSQMMTALIRTFIGHVLWRKRKSVWDYVGAMVAAPFVMVSVVGGYMNRVVGNVFRILAGEKQKFEGEPISNLATGTLEKFFLGIGQTTKAAAFYLTGEEDKAKVQIKAATRNFILSIGTMKGVPVRQIEKVQKAVESEDVPKHIGGYI